MNFPIAAFVNFSGEIRNLAQATHDEAKEYLANFSEHPLVKAGLDANQLLAVARMIYEVSQVIDQQQMPDTLGALSDRVHMKQGEYPVKVVLDETAVNVEEGEHLLSEMEEMGRLAELPILLATEEEKTRFLSHKLVKEGIPSNAFRALRANGPGMKEAMQTSVDFEGIVSELAKEEPDRFGGDFPDFGPKPTA